MKFGEFKRMVLDETGEDVDLSLIHILSHGARKTMKTNIV